VNRAQAKQILLLYRPGIDSAADPEVADALELVRQDPELASWFEQHQAFQAAMRSKLRQLDVPAHLPEMILTSHKVVRPALFWQRPVWIAAAAIFLILLGIAALALRPSVPDRFTNYRETMVSAAVRMYGMDLETGDQARLRNFIEQKGAPADYRLTQGLEQLPLKGGGLQRWRGNPVSMVCFNRPGEKMLFLFVLKRSALKDPPPETPAKAELAQLAGLMTASWTQGDNAYLLAGADESGFVEKYLPRKN